MVRTEIPLRQGDELIVDDATETPGASWSYSSPGYVLLAHVVERAAATPYRRFLADRIFAPLGLTRTFAGAPDGRPGLARGHDPAGEPVPTWELDVVGMGAGGGITTATTRASPRSPRPSRNRTAFPEPLFV